jgi:hypothetical protein
MLYESYYFSALWMYLLRSSSNRFDEDRYSMTQQNSAVSRETRLLNGCITIQSKSLDFHCLLCAFNPFHVKRETL